MSDVKPWSTIPITGAQHDEWMRRRLVTQWSAAALLKLRYSRVPGHDRPLVPLPASVKV